MGSSHPLLKPLFPLLEDGHKQGPCDHSAASEAALWRVSVLHQGWRRGRNGWKEEQGRSPGLRISYTPAHSRPSCQHTTAPCSSSGYRKAGFGPWGLTDRGEDNAEVDDTSTGAGCVVSEEAGAKRETHSGRGAANAQWKRNQAVQIAIMCIIPILETRKLRHREAE